MRRNRFPLIGAVSLSFIYIISAMALERLVEPWATPTVFAPLGYDEFGRNFLATLFVSSINSLAFGVAITAVSLAFSIGLAASIVSIHRDWPRLAVEGICYIFEAIPVIIWVIMVAILIPTSGKLLVAMAFCLATVPFFTRLLIGEFNRLLIADFVDAARLQEMPLTRVIIVHLLPNARAILTPTIVQACGLAIAADGAVAIAGSANRTELSLGVMLIRGKENILSHPSLLSFSIMAILACYLVLWLFIRRQVH